MAQAPTHQKINFNQTVNAAITITDAEVEPGQQYWVLSKVHYKDDNDKHHQHSPNYNGGLHHIFFEEPYGSAFKMAVYYEDAHKTEYIPLNEKQPPDPAGNSAMYADNKYTAFMYEKAGDQEVPTDKISGMRMWGHHHASFHLWWEKRTK